MYKKGIIYSFLAIIGLLLGLYLKAQTTDINEPAAILELKQTLEQDRDGVSTAFQIAQIYAETNHPAFNLDSALSYINLAQRNLRNANKGLQKRLEKGGITQRKVNQFKSGIKESALDAAIDSGTSAEVETFLEKYPKINFEQTTKAFTARNRFGFMEASQLNDYDSLLLFWTTYQKEIKEFNPDLVPQIEAAALTTYFIDRDSTDLPTVLGLLGTFPRLAPDLDQKLSIAFSKQPFVSLIERQIESIDKKFLPKTVRAIYHYYAFEGSLNDLVQFNGRYPQYIDSFTFKQDLATARAAPELKAYEEDQKAVYTTFIQTLAPKYQAFIALQKMIGPAVKAKRWEEAKNIVLDFAPYFGENHPLINDMLHILDASEYGLKATPLNAFVNTESGEYAPVLSFDERLLFFCRRNNGSENIYFSKWLNEDWSIPIPAKPLDKAFVNEAPLSISADGSMLVLFEDGEVHYSTRKIPGWSRPLRFFADNSGTQWQGGTVISADQKVTIFAARRDDVVGLLRQDNIDLFIRYRQNDGQWGPPINLGTTINTPFEDRSPFLHPDMRTLYFSSRGHGGLGSLDVYKTTRIGDSWTEWTKPVNLGKEINTPLRDWGYRITTNGETAYFAVDINGKSEDLFSIPMPDHLRPEKVSTLKGKIVDSKGTPLDVELIIEDLDTGEEIATVKPDPESGDFFITLPSGRRYAYRVNGEDYFPVSDHLDLRAKDDRVDQQKEIVVPSVEEMVAQEMTIALNNLFFDYDKYKIQAASYQELNRVADLIKKHGLAIEIAGHTDNQGDADYNLLLSKQRANAVKAYLVDRGCFSESIQTIGFGMTEPIATNDNEEGRSKNRRVEVRIKNVE